MDAGERDRTIQILRSSEAFDGFQHGPANPVVYITRTAKATPVKDSERFAGGETQATISYRFEVAYDPETATIDERDQLYYVDRAQTCEIIGVKEIGRREGLEISAVARSERAA